METETLNNKSGVAESETLFNTLARTPPKGKIDSVVHTLADTLAQIKSKTLGDTLKDVRPKPLVETLRLQTVGDTLIDVEAKTVIDTLAYKLLKEKAETVSDTRCHFQTRLLSTTWLRRQQK